MAWEAMRQYFDLPSFVFPLEYLTVWTHLLRFAPTWQAGPHKVNCAGLSV